MVITDFPAGYKRVLGRVRHRGHIVSPRDEVTREIVNFHLTILDTSRILPVGSGRRVSLRLAEELNLQLLAGVYDASRLQFTSQFTADDALENYGPLLRPGIERSIQYLQDDLFTRRACANLGHTGRDSGYPCTTSLGWLMRNGELHAFSEMRSQDAWLGMPYDLHMFAGLQHAISYVLGVRAGPMHHRVRSLHLYAKDIDHSLAVQGAQSSPPATTVLASSWNGVVAGALKAMR